MRTLRIVSYVVNGSGVGHLTRQIAILRWVRRLAAVRGVRAEIWFLTSSEADGALFREKFASFKLPSKTTITEADIDKTTYLALAKQWVWHSIGLLRPDLLVVDTFPRGSFGELLSALDLCKKRAFVFRPVKSELSSRADFQAMMPLYDAILVPEREEDARVVVPEQARHKLHYTGPICAREPSEILSREAARERLGAKGDVVYVSAGGGGDAGAEAFLHGVCDALAGSGATIAIGAGPLYRGRRVGRVGVVWLGADEPAALARAFDVAVCACGYNTYVELMHLGVPAVFWPQEKIADDQRERAERARRAGAAAIAESIDDVAREVARLRDPETNRRAREAARSLVPTTHARDAAAELLRLVLPAHDVESAEEILDERAIALLARGVPASAIAAVATSLEPRPRDVPGAIDAADAGRLAVSVLERCAELAVPTPSRVCDAIARLFAEATPAARAAACTRVLDALAPFGDWEAAVIFLKSFTTERAMPPPAFTDALCAALAELRRRGATLLERARGEPRAEQRGGPPRARGAPVVKVPLALVGVDTGIPVVGPETLHVDVTNSCNTNCITCWDHSPLLSIGRSKEWKRMRIDGERIEPLLDDVLSLGGLRAVILSGQGEPFTHPDIWRWIEAVKSRGLHLTIITNLVAADAVRIVELGVDQLLIGVHGASCESYLAFHPSFREEEWRRLLGMLEALRPRRYKHVQVICNTNAHELVEMIDFAHRFDAAQVNFKLASLAAGTESARVDDQQRARLAADLVPRARARARELGVVTNLDVFAQQLATGGEATAPIADVGCFMGYAYARVLVDGTVLYCCNTEVVVGTLGEAPFSTLWGGARWTAMRERMRRGDYFASCSQCGKFNQNVALAHAFASAYGEERLREVTGRA